MNEATIAKKQEQVELVSEKMANAGSTVFVDYLGLTVAEVSELRNKLHAENCQMKVIKNNILRRAAAGAGFEVPAENFVGPSAAIFSQDEVTGSKIVFGFAKEHEKLTVKGGVVDSQIMTVDQLKQFHHSLQLLHTTIQYCYCLPSIHVLLHKWESME